MNESNNNDNLNKNSKPYVYYIEPKYKPTENNINNGSYNVVQDSKEENDYGYIALGLSLVLVGVLLICFIFSGGNFDEQKGIVWLFAGIYCYLGELPVMIISIILGIKGLKNNNKTPSYISFLINFLKIAFVLFIMLPR